MGQAPTHPTEAMMIIQLMQPIHERMPVIIPPNQYDLWLDRGCQDPDKLAKLLRPYPSQDMIVYRVSTLVNDPKNDAPGCIRAVR
jgi:putative SOS response-associated peptidase YedK